MKMAGTAWGPERKGKGVAYGKAVHTFSLSASALPASGLSSDLPPTAPHFGFWGSPCEDPPLSCTWVLGAGSASWARAETGHPLGSEGEGE